MFVLEQYPDVAFPSQTALNHFKTVAGIGDDVNVIITDQPPRCDITPFYEAFTTIFPSGEPFEAFIPEFGSSYIWACIAYHFYLCSRGEYLRQMEYGHIFRAFPGTIHHILQEAPAGIRFKLAEQVRKKALEMYFPYDGLGLIKWK